MRREMMVQKERKNSENEERNWDRKQEMRDE